MIKKEEKINVDYKNNTLEKEFIDIAAVSLKPFPEITRNVEQFKKELKANKVSAEFLKLCKDTTAGLKLNNTVKINVIKKDKCF